MEAKSQEYRSEVNKKTSSCKETPGAKSKRLGKGKKKTKVKVNI